MSMASESSDVLPAGSVAVATPNSPDGDAMNVGLKVPAPEPLVITAALPSHSLPPPPGHPLAE